MGNRGHATARLVLLLVLIPLDPLHCRIPKHADDPLGDFLAPFLWGSSAIQTVVELPGDGV